MIIRRRDFLKTSAAATLVAGLPRLARGADTASVYDLERFGNARILHLTYTHAQLKPVFFRESSVNLGVGAMAGHAAAGLRQPGGNRFRVPAFALRRACHARAARDATLAAAIEHIHRHRPAGTWCTRWYMC